MLAACHRLADYRKKRSRVVQKQALKRTAETRFLPQVLRLHPPRAARELNDRLVGSDDTAQEDIDAHNSLAANDADLDRTPIVRGVDHRDHGFFGKIHGLDFLIPTQDDLT